MIRLVSTLAALAPIGLSLPAQSVLLVPQQYATVQAAIAASQSGDTVLVGPGSYLGPFTFPAHDITLRGAGPEVSILRTTTFDPVITCLQGSTRNAVIEGFTIRDGNGFDAGGIYVNRCSPTIRDNHIVHNRTSGRGGGIGVYFGSPLVEGNLIANNTQSIGQVRGGGIELFGVGSADIIGNRIRDNDALSGGGISINGAGTPRILGNRIQGNTADRGGGIAMVNIGTYTIVQNLITGNAASFGGAINHTNGDLLLVHNTIADNLGVGSAIWAFRPIAVLTLVNNVMVGTGTLLYGDSWRPAVQHVYSHNVLHAPTVYGGDWPDWGTANGTILADPRLRADRIHLAWESPARDQGVPHPLAPATDWFGDDRVLGSAVDIGADEYSATFPFGNECHGQLSAPTLRPIGQPLLGNQTFGFELRGGVLGGSVIFGIGDSLTTWLGEPLPAGLARYGLPGCWQLVSGLYSALENTDPTGSAVIDCPVPAAPGLFGVLLHAQWGAMTTPVGQQGQLDGVSGGLSFELR